MLVGLLGLAQPGHLDPLVRTTLLVLLVSGSHHRLSVVRWLQKAIPVRQTAAWPADLLRFWLVLVYLSVGLNKLGAAPVWID